MQPGWYHAQGDPAGTQRYWNGSQWVGGPQALGQPQDSPGHGAHGFGAAAGQGVVQPATSYGPRAIAWVIDTWPAWLVTVLNVSIEGNIVLALQLLALAYIVVSKGVMMGQTGQSVGKRTQGIRLVSTVTGRPLGVGLAILRLLVSWVFIVLCLLPYILDHLWPLWDPKGERLLDKIFNTRVVQA